MTRKDAPLVFENQEKLIRVFFLFLEIMIGRSLVAAAAAALVSTILLSDSANASAIPSATLEVLNSSRNVSRRATDEPIIDLDFPDPTILEDGNNCEYCVYLLLKMEDIG